MKKVECSYKARTEKIRVTKSREPPTTLLYRTAGELHAALRTRSEGIWGASILFFHFAGNNSRNTQRNR